MGYLAFCKRCRMVYYFDTGNCRMLPQKCSQCGYERYKKDEPKMLDWFGFVDFKSETGVQSTFDGKEVKA